LGRPVPLPLVVIVDDRITNLKILQRLAASAVEGTTARTFTDPLAALAECGAHPPDLVVIDLKMPELAGAEFIRRLHDQPGCGDVAVIAIAAYEDRELVHTALDAGASDFLLSPVDHREFRARARNLLAIRSKRSEPDEPSGSQPALEGLLRVIDAIPMMICATDRDGRYLFANRHFASFAGVRPTQLIGRRPVEAHDDGYSHRLMERDKRLLTGAILPATFEENAVGGDGLERVLLTTTDSFAGGDEAMVVTVSLDITERKAAELASIAAKEQAEIANRSKTEFLANMSHELRTPLNAIIGFSQVMAGEMLGPITTQKYVGYAHDIVASAEHLLGIINDILDVSKLEAGKLDLVEESIDLAKAIADLLQLVEGKALAGDVRLATRSDRDLPRLRGDARKVKQILLNLLTNAIKFSHPSGEVEIAARAEGGAISVAVIDHGIGMDAAEIELALSRFGQVASVESRRHAGTGLGLPLAIGLAELHGATVNLRSTKGAGTTATVTFPRERSEPAADRAAGDRAARGA
jgi:PAS domain S-box-containing protein